MLSKYNHIIFSDKVSSFDDTSEVTTEFLEQVSDRENILL